MIPVVAGEYKLVLVGDSAVGTLLFTKASPPCWASSSTASSMSIYSQPSESISSLEGSRSELMRWSCRSGTQPVHRPRCRTGNLPFDSQRILQQCRRHPSLLRPFQLRQLWSISPLTQSLKDYWLPEAQNNNKTSAKIFVIGNKLDAKREV